MNGRLALPRTDLTTAAGGLVGTALVVLFVERVGTSLGLSLMFGLTFLAALVVAYVAFPHVAVAATIPIFVVVPTLKTFVHPFTGAIKDLIVLAAVTAAGVVFLQRRAARKATLPDRTVSVLVACLLLLYVANAGGQLSGETGYGPAWFHGVRLVAEPLSLLMVGLTVREPRRTFRWSAMSLIWTSVAVALIGLGQQALGVERLLELGYSYGGEVRQAFGQLRSFGTLAEPFAYASFLLFGLAALLLWRRRGTLVSLAVPLVGLGLAVSFVRTAAFVATALVALAFAKRGNLRFATPLMLAAMVAGIALFVAASQERSTRVVQVSANQYLTLNGRTQVWQEELGTSPASWLIGRGVGATGTASQRAETSLTGAELEERDEGVIVDSAYLVVVADVGLLGLAVMLALLYRLGVLAWRGASRGDGAGWVALGVLAVMLLDALTRESFTAFPTAYVGMLLVGLALGASSEAALRRPAGPLGYA